MRHAARFMRGSADQRAEKAVSGLELCALLDMRKSVIAFAAFSLAAASVPAITQGAAVASTTSTSFTITTAANMKKVEAGNGVIFTFHVTTTKAAGVSFSDFEPGAITGGTSFYDACIFGGVDATEGADGDDCEYTRVTPSAPGVYTIGVQVPDDTPGTIYPGKVSASFCVVVFGTDHPICATARASTFE